METIIELYGQLQNNNVEYQDKFYREFSRIICSDNKDTIEEIVSKTWDLIQKNIISKDIVYFSILVNKNIELLEACLRWDKTVLQLNFKDAFLLYDYTIYSKKHWFIELSKNSVSNINEIFTKSVYNKFIYLQLLIKTNDSLGENFNLPLLQILIKSVDQTNTDTTLDSFWMYYFKEIQNILRMVEYCETINSEVNKFDVLNYAGQNCILAVASQYLNLCDDYVCERFFNKIKELDISHDEDVDNQYKTLESFTVLATCCKLIVPNCTDIKTLNINDIIDDIGQKILNIKDHTQQIELLELIFTNVFIKYNEILSVQNTNFQKPIVETFVCNEKEIRIILFLLKTLIDKIKFKKIYQNGSDELNRLNRIHKIVSDANWRLELIVNLKSSSKCSRQLIYYMLAEPESLINICLKGADFSRAFQVLKIFDMESSSLAQEIVFTKKLQELKDTFKRTIKIRDIQNSSPNISMPNVSLQFDNIAEEFLIKNPTVLNDESDKIIEKAIENYPFLDHYKSKNELFMNILDLAITQTETVEDSAALLHLASKYNTLSKYESDFSKFNRKLLILFNEIAVKHNLTLPDILLNPQIILDRDKFQKEETFFNNLEELYDEFCMHIKLVETGTFNKDHPSHKTIQKLNKCCSDYLEDKSTKEPCEIVKYLQKLFSYLKAFSKVLYIEKDSSDLIANGKNSSYFDLLFHNRSELMGKLLFQQNLDPTEFEKYFSKLKLDFLYHVTGNCFPTINLHAEENITQEELYPENYLYTPNKAIITYIQKRNWLLALILNEMYSVEDFDIDVSESRIQIFLNYLRLPKIDNLQELFRGNEIVTALQNEISYQKVHDYVYAEMGKQDFASSSQTSRSSQSLESAEEIYEDKLKTTNWKKLYSIIDSIPEIQIKKQSTFIVLRDMVLANLVKDAFECEYYKFSLEINDRNLRINILLENMKAWPEDFCIKMIKSEISRLDQEHDEKIDELKLWLHHVEHSKKIMKILGVSTWANMYSMCTFQPKDVIDKLLLCKEVELLLEFLDLHEVSRDMLLCINETFLEDSFESGISLSTIKKLLDKIPFEHSIFLCQNLLGILKNVSHLQFITNYLRANVKDETLNNVTLALNMLSIFSSNEFDQQLLLLLKDPMSIIEVLVMNTKLDKLAAVLDVIRPHIPITEFNEDTISVEKIDELLRRYAEKSLDFRVITQPNPRLLRTPDHTLLQSLDSLNLDPSSNAFVMPEDVPSREEWVNNTDVIECMCCMNVFFSMFNRRHHCRRCGRVICASCSKNRMTVPSYEDILVRVCSDCYDQTFGDNSISADAVSTRSVLYDYWILTNDAEHNRILRDEFSYEFAPSVSLCLSLMKLHSKCDDYSKFLLEQCEILLKLLIPIQEPVQEIDYLLIIRMLKSLAMAAKMASQDTSIQYGSSSADRVLNQAELVGLLAERGCLNLLPTTGTISFIDAITLRRLTDKLLENEQWNLALEVSTKAGLDKSGVFVAWGKSCLKAGSLAMAREKLSKCLDKNAKRDTTYYQFETSSVKVVTNPPLLNEIVKILESKKEPIDQEIVTTVDNQKLLTSTMTLNQSITSTFQSDSPVFILNKLKNLKNIELGYYSVKKTNEKKAGKKLEKFIYDECVYYLNKYGTPLSLVEFHIKYGNFYEALNCIKALNLNKGKKQLGPDTFVTVYMTCLKEGAIETFQACMSEIDSTLNTWKDHLMQTCFHLKKHNYLNSLYQLQQYMGDYIRAAMTCVRFYEEKAISYTDLLKNNHFLHKSEDHFKQAIEQDQWVEVSMKDEVTQSKPTFEEKSIMSPMIKRLSHDEIEKHCATIRMQIEVTKFLAECETNGVFPMQTYMEMVPNPDNLPRHKITIPTLFGSSDQRKYLVVLCLVCGKTIDDGFEISLRIMNRYELKPIKIYNEAGKYLAQVERFHAIAELVNCIHKASGTTNKQVNEICDDMLILAVATLNKTNAPEASVEELIKLMSDKSAKISAYIEAKQLKTAYFLATKHKKVADIRRISREAELSNQPNIKKLCDQYLRRYSQTVTSSTSNS